MSSGRGIRRSFRVDAQVRPEVTATLSDFFMELLLPHQFGGRFSYPQGPGLLLGGSELFPVDLVWRVYNSDCGFKYFSVPLSYIKVGRIFYL